MTPDEQEFASRRYTYAPTLCVPLSSGRIAIALGFNPFPLLYIAEDWHEVADYLAGLAEAQHAEWLARRNAPPPAVKLDLSLALTNIRSQL